MSAVNECNTSCHFLTSNHSRNNNNQTSAPSERFLLTVGKLQVDLVWRCRVQTENYVRRSGICIVDFFCHLSFFLVK